MLINEQFLSGEYYENFQKLINANNEDVGLTSAINSLREIYENCLFLTMNKDWPFDNICEALEKIFDDYTLLIDEDKEHERKCLLIKNDIKFNEEFFVDIVESNEPYCLRMYVCIMDKYNYSASLNIPLDYFLTKKINERNPELFKEYTRAISIFKTEAEENLKYYTELYNQISDEDKLYMELSE